MNQGVISKCRPGVKSWCRLTIVNQPIERAGLSLKPGAEFAVHARHRFARQHFQKQRCSDLIFKGKASSPGRSRGSEPLALEGAAH